MFGLLGHDAAFSNVEWTNAEGELKLPFDITAMFAVDGGMWCGPLDLDVDE